MLIMCLVVVVVVVVVVVLWLLLSGDEGVEDSFGSTSGDGASTLIEAVEDHEVCEYAYLCVLYVYACLCVYVCTGIFIINPPPSNHFFS